MKKCSGSCSGNPPDEGWGVGRLMGWLAGIGLGMCAWVACDPPEQQEVVLRYRDEVLTREELNQAIPPGVDTQDSVMFARLYIDRWKREQVWAAAARQELDDAEERIRFRLSSYARNLMGQELQHVLLHERLDTAVTRKQLETYYKAHIEQFQVEQPRYRYIYFRVGRRDAPVPALLRQLPPQSPAEVEELTAWGDRYAEMYTLESGYVRASRLEELAPGRQLNRQPPQKPTTWQTWDGGSATVHIFCMLDRIKAGWPLPLEVVSDEVRKIILETRRQRLIQTFESDLLQEAAANQDFR